MDILYLGIGIGLVLLGLGLVHACARLERRREPSR